MSVAGILYFAFCCLLKIYFVCFSAELFLSESVTNRGSLF